jgi:hypothetical protein
MSKGRSSERWDVASASNARRTQTELERQAPLRHGPRALRTALVRAPGRGAVQLSANLTEEQKMIAECWADGPRSELPTRALGPLRAVRRPPRPPRPRGARPRSRREALLRAHECGPRCRHLRMGQQMLLRLSPAGHRGPLAFQDTKVTAWARPYQGTREIDGAAWFPYQPTTFPTPPFPDYSSGHSNFSAAGAAILWLFTGSDRFGGSVMFAKGSSRSSRERCPKAPLTLVGHVLGGGRPGRDLSPLRRNPLRAGGHRREADGCSRRSRPGRGRSGTSTARPDRLPSALSAAGRAEP